MLTIAWDVDDVLNNLMQEWLNKKWLPDHSGCRIRFNEIIQNPPHQLLKVSKEEYLKSLDEFRLSKEFTKIRPLAETKKWFLKYGDNFRHLVITAVPVKAAAVSAVWTLTNFGRWIRTFHFVPSLRREEKNFKYDRTKKDFLKWLGKVDIFIDDNELNLAGSQELGIRGILFPRPWNSSKLTITQTLELIAKFSPLKE